MISDVTLGDIARIKRDVEEGLAEFIEGPPPSREEIRSRLECHLQQRFPDARVTWGDHHNLVVTGLPPDPDVITVDITLERTFPFDVEIANEVTCPVCHTEQTPNPSGFCRIQRCGAPLRYKPAARK